MSETLDSIGSRIPMGAHELWEIHWVAETLRTVAAGEREEPPESHSAMTTLLSQHAEAEAIRPAGTRRVPERP